MSKTNPSTVKRLRRKLHIRKSVQGTTLRPRLSVFRSAKHIYVQLIDDDTGRTLAHASTLEASFKEASAYGGNKGAAKLVGRAIGERTLALGIKQVVFDRNGFLYHGRVQALADAARESGLEF